MENEFSDFGRLILTEDAKPRGLIIFYPPATGEKGQQFIEATNLAKLNFASLLYDPPYRRTPQGGIEDLKGETELWLRAQSEFKIVLSKAKKYFDFTAQDIAVVGKNMGGSVASFATDDRIRCLVVTGSVPILSNFWIRSEHPVAVENRNGFSTSQLIEFENATALFDLVMTAPQKKIPTLIQFGKKDLWIETTQSKFFIEKLNQKQTIQWTEDDHAMNSRESVTQRNEFILGCFE